VSYELRKDMPIQVNLNANDLKVLPSYKVSSKLMKIIKGDTNSAIGLVAPDNFANIGDYVFCSSNNMVISYSQKKINSEKEILGNK
jgi:hypothetical protein